VYAKTLITHRTLKECGKAMYARDAYTREELVNNVLQAFLKSVEFNKRWKKRNWTIPLDKITVDFKDV